MRSRGCSELQIDLELQKEMSTCNIVEDQTTCCGCIFQYTWYCCCLPYRYLYRD